MDLFGESSPAPVLPEGSVHQAAPYPDSGTAFSVLGHESVQKRLLSFIQNQRLPHGLIFFGPKGVGKSLMARRFAARLLASRPNENFESLDVPANSQAVQLMRAGGHPDFLSITRPYDEAKDRFKDAITIEEVRKIGGFLSLTSTEGGWRVVLIDDADCMNRNAQNAVLKILEEPPSKTLLILVAHRLGPLLPTILSRTQRVQFHNLSQDILEALFAQELTDTDPADYPALLDFAQGSIGRAVTFSEHDGPELYQKTIGLLESKTPDWSEIHKLADSMAKTAQEPVFQNFQSIVLVLLEKICAEKAKGLCSFILDFYSLEQVLDIYSAVRAHFDQANHANLDNRATVLGAFRIILAS